MKTRKAFFQNHAKKIEGKISNFGFSIVNLIKSPYNELENRTNIK